MFVFILALDGLVGCVAWLCFVVLPHSHLTMEFKQWINNGKGNIYVTIIGMKFSSPKVQTTSQMQNQKNLQLWRLIGKSSA